MSAVLSGPTAWGQAQSVCLDRPIDSLAAFFDDGALAAKALHRLAERPGLAHAQLALLGPADGSWLAFLQRARAMPVDELDPPWHRDPWLLALIGAVAGGLAVTVALLGDSVRLDLRQGVVLYLLSSMVGAALGAGLARLSRWLPPYDHFERVMRRRLAAGHWAVRVRGVPWAQQAEVAEWLSELDGHWYAVSARVARVARV